MMRETRKNAANVRSSRKSVSCSCSSCDGPNQTGEGGVEVSFVRAHPSTTRPSHAPSRAQARAHPRSTEREHSRQECRCPRQIWTTQETRAHQLRSAGACPALVASADGGGRGKTDMDASSRTSHCLSCWRSSAVRSDDIPTDQTSGMEGQRGGGGESVGVEGKFELELILPVMSRSISDRCTQNREPIVSRP